MVVGLGNMGTAYEGTRHNFGFEVVRHFAQEIGLSFRSKKEFVGHICSGQWKGNDLILLLPSTLMNGSGRSVRRVVDFYKLTPSALIILSDDVDLPLGAVRYRSKGSAGGHNGLKSVAQHLGTTLYPRLRIGIGRPPLGTSMEQFVLSRFIQGEKELYLEGLEKAILELRRWLEQGWI